MPNEKGYKKKEDLMMSEGSNQSNDSNEKQENTTCYDTTHQSQAGNHSRSPAIRCYTNQDKGHHLQKKREKKI